MIKLILTTFLLATLLLTGCVFQTKWRAIYYPDDSLPGKYLIGPEFSTIEDCTQYGKEKEASQDNSSFACGQGCRVRDDSVYLCDKTLYKSYNQDPKI